MIDKYSFWIKVIQFVNMNPLFKGGATVAVGIFALLFALWMRKRFNEPATIFYKIFIGLCIFIMLYGSYILVFRPNWWTLPY